MNRRDFMRKILGGGAAALVGATVPIGLRPDEVAALEEYIQLGWDPKTLTMTVVNHTSQARHLSVTISSHAPTEISMPVAPVDGIPVQLGVRTEWVPRPSTPELGRLVLGA